MKEWYKVSTVVSFKPESINNDRRIPIFVTDKGFISTSTGVYYYYEKEPKGYAVYLNNTVLTKLENVDFVVIANLLGNLYYKVLNKI